MITYVVALYYKTQLGTTHQKPSINNVFKLPAGLRQGLPNEGSWLGTSAVPERSGAYLVLTSEDAAVPVDEGCRPTLLEHLILETKMLPMGHRSAFNMTDLMAAYHLAATL